MATIKKEKNWLVLTNDDGKSNRLNMETGEIIGKLGKPVKKLSPDLYSWCVNNANGDRPDRCYAWAIIYAYQRDAFSVILRADKILSLGLLVVPDDICNMRDDRFNAMKLTKQVVDYIKDNYLGVFTYERYCESEFMKDLTNDEMALMRDYKNAIPQHIKTNKSELKKCLAWLSYLVNIEKIDQLDGSRYTVTYLTNYFNMCIELEKTDIYQKNFYRNLCIIKFDHEQQKDKILYAKIKKHQEQAKLEYTNDVFTIIVPTTAEQFTDEGRQQQNCVGHNYHRWVADGNGNIAFLRLNSNPNVSYITLQIQNDGRICQAKARFNREPNSEQWKLINAYQTYLKSR